MIINCQIKTFSISSNESKILASTTLDVSYDDKYASDMKKYMTKKLPSKTTIQVLFDTFNSDLIGQSGRSEGAGFYFTTERSVAEGYGEGGRVLEVYLNIKNPMRYQEPAFSRAKTVELISVVAKIEALKEEMDIRDGFLSNFADTYSGSIERAYQVAADLLCEEDDALSQIGSLIGSGVSADIVNSGLYQALGFDGFLAKGFSGMGKSGGQIWIAMKPQQIKSATENCGLFDPENPNFKS